MTKTQPWEWLWEDRRTYANHLYNFFKEKSPEQIVQLYIGEGMPRMLVEDFLNILCGGCPAGNEIRTEIAKMTKFAQKRPECKINSIYELGNEKFHLIYVVNHQTGDVMLRPVTPSELEKYTAIQPDQYNTYHELGQEPSQTPPKCKPGPDDIEYLDGHAVLK